MGKINYFNDMEIENIEDLGDEVEVEVYFKNEKKYKKTFFDKELFDQSRLSELDWNNSDWEDIEEEIER